MYLLSCCIFTSCSKSLEFNEKNLSRNDTLFKEVVPGIKFTIKKGQHFSEQNIFQKIEISHLKFKVKFDSTAVYKTILHENQYDINKLYGFSDNNSNHHSYSARFGWRWSDNALHLFAYIYNEGKNDSKEICIIPIGEEINCSIKIEGNDYVFTAGGYTEILPRLSKTSKARGYMLFPYFGGDEVAPQDLNIWIKND